MKDLQKQEGPADTDALPLNEWALVDNKSNLDEFTDNETVSVMTRSPMSKVEFISAFDHPGKSIKFSTL